MARRAGPSPREQYARKDERNILRALSPTRFYSASDIRRGLTRRIPDKDFVAALKRLHSGGYVLQAPLPNGKNGWRLTAAGKARIAPQDKTGKSPAAAG